MRVKKEWWEGVPGCFAREVMFCFLIGCWLHGCINFVKIHPAVYLGFVHLKNTHHTSINSLVKTKRGACP